MLIRRTANYIYIYIYIYIYVCVCMCGCMQLIQPTAGQIWYKIILMGWGAMHKSRLMRSRHKKLLHPVGISFWSASGVKWYIYPSYVGKKALWDQVINLQWPTQRECLVCLLESRSSSAAASSADSTEFPWPSLAIRCYRLPLLTGPLNCILRSHKADI